MRLAFRIAARELRGGLRGFRVFLLCLILGVAAIAAVGLVREAIRSGLADQGAVLLGGDAQYEFTYRRATEAERGWITDHAAAVSEVVDFRSMAGTPAGDYALTQVKAVDAAYPLVGALQLDPPLPVSALDEGAPGVFLDPALADRLEVTPGDPVLIGGQEFVMKARIAREPDTSGGGFTMGPRSIVSLRAIEATPMLAPGSLYESEYRVLLMPGETLPGLQAAARQQFEGAGMRWSDSRRAAPGAERFTSRLASFLVLVGLAGLAVGGVGISSTTSAWIERKAGTIATLRALGATAGTIRSAFLIQLAVLGLGGIVTGIALASLGVLLAAGPITRLMPIPIEVGLAWRPLAEAAVYGALTAAVFALWPLSRMETLRAATLYRASDRRGRRLPRWPALALIGGLAAALVGFAALLSGMPGLTVAVLGGVAGALLVLALAALGLRWLAGRVRPLARGRPALHAALAAISGPRSEVVAVVLSLGLGLSVLAAIGQIESNLRNAISGDLPKQAPAFFIIDIQPDQLQPLLAQVEAVPGVSRIDTAPMLRGVVTQINGRPAREVGGDHWVLRGDRGVTFADAPRERLTEGEWWPRDYSGPPQVSMGAKEAAELGLKLGDQITVNILGRDITATISSFREVNFSTAGIGFVLTLNPAALAGAPYTEIATVYAPPEAEATILRETARAFPNVTAIRVSDAIARLTEALTGIARAVAVAASVTLLTGLVVLIGTAASGEAARAREAALLRTLGATRGMVLWSFALRSLLMGAAAGAIAVALGALSAWAALRFVMEMGYSFAPAPALAVVCGGVAVTVLAGAAFALRPLALRPARVLRAPE
ncbi:ABC transporter permease [Paenirhodobacter populi]|uniref:ABC transporter permease n=1 Tax=Paenirhodobacter populi TaxID=2306993 RepID=UPI000FE3F5DD|nr:FtsX-like permease family protein [Sinirhodobacter populi]RWR11583.1 FtsX-like permease family protein [Sinirhodobacter populi]